MFQTTNQLWCWLKDIPLKGWLMESYPEPWSITKRIFPTSGIDPKSTRKKHVWLRIAMNKLMSTVICRYESTIIDSYLRDSQGAGPKNKWSQHISATQMVPIRSPVSPNPGWPFTTDDPDQNGWPCSCGRRNHQIPEKSGRLRSTFEGEKIWGVKHDSWDIGVNHEI